MAHCPGQKAGRSSLSGVIWFFVVLSLAFVSFHLLYSYLYVPLYLLLHSIYWRRSAHGVPSCSSCCLSLLLRCSHSPDRLSRVVYEQLQQQHADLYAGRRAGLLLLLLGLLLQDRHDSRQAALLKRLLQVSTYLLL